jgi:ribosomal protein S18 acetylase RimI-like enzyme
MRIFEVGQVTDELVEGLRRLIPQLSSRSPSPTEAQLAEILSSNACVMFVAHDPGVRGRIVGTLTLVMFRIPTGLRAWIEDVIVDEDARGRGIGEALVRTALKRASKLGAGTVDLTSSPSREGANRLYQRIGFVRRDTNVYRYAKKSGKGGRGVRN